MQARGLRGEIGTGGGAVLSPIQMGRIIGTASLAAGVGLGAYTAHEVTTEDVPVEDALRLVAGSMTMAGLGVTLMLTQPSALATAAKGVGTLGAVTNIGLAFR